MAYDLNKEWVYIEDSNSGLHLGYQHLSYDRDTDTNTYLVRCYYGSGSIPSPTTTGTCSWSLRFVHPFAFTIKGQSAQYINSTFPLSGWTQSSHYYAVLTGTSITRKQVPTGAPDAGLYCYWLLDDVTVTVTRASALGGGATYPFGIVKSGGYWSDSWVTCKYSSSETTYKFTNDVQVGLPFVDDRIVNGTSSFDVLTGEMTWSFLQAPSAVDESETWGVSVRTTCNDEIIFEERTVPDEVWQNPDANGTYRYTFTITPSERAKLWEVADLYGDKDSYDGKVYISLISKDYTHFYNSDGSLSRTIEDPYYDLNKVYLDKRPPVVTGEVYDINEETLALTGNKDVLVRFHSTAHFTVSAEGQDGATIVQTSATNVGGIIAGSEGSFTNVESNIFHLDAVDSRGASSRLTITKDWIEYIKLTANIKANELSADGFASITIGGNYYGGSFGLVENTLTLAVRYKTGSGEYGEWVTVTPSIGGSGTYEYTIELEGLDYMETYTFQAKAQDRLESIVSAEKVVTTIPVFDWGHDDFNFNVPVTVQGAQIATNKILWQGSSAMYGSDSIDLSEPISAQAHGIVLVFSGTDVDVSWVTHFVPKIMPQINFGGGQLFMWAINSGFSKFGGKYLYINDETIAGHATNETADTNSNIDFDNNVFVLRYVIGV